MELSLKQQHVLETKIMAMTADQSIAYLEKKHGYKMTRRNYYAILKGIRESTVTRLFEIVKDYKEEHIERLDTIKSVQNKLWELYHAKKTIVVKGKPVQVDQTPLERARILDDILKSQPYYSAFYEATAYLCDSLDELRRKNSKMEEWYKSEIAGSRQSKSMLHGKTMKDPYMGSNVN